MATDTQQIMEELRAIKTDLEYIKEHMVDVDTILTPEEEERLNESLKDYKEGKTISVEKFERERAKNVPNRVR